jgi:hypothetical protein
METTNSKTLSLPVLPIIVRAWQPLLLYCRWYVQPMLSAFVLSLLSIGPKNTNALVICPIV